MLENQINQDVKSVVELLGKEVSFVVTFNYGGDTVVSEYKGKVTNVVLSLSSSPEISINDGDFFVLSELLEFQCFS